jgi:hypothetical protein
MRSDGSRFVANKLEVFSVATELVRPFFQKISVFGLAVKSSHLMSLSVEGNTGFGADGADQLLSREEVFETHSGRIGQKEYLSGNQPIAEGQSLPIGTESNLTFGSYRPNEPVLSRGTQGQSPREQ